MLGIFSECGTVFYRVRYGAVHTFSYTLINKRFSNFKTFSKILYSQKNISHKYDDFIE